MHSSYLQIASITQQLTSANAALGARVFSVEVCNNLTMYIYTLYVYSYVMLLYSVQEERTQLNIQLQSINSSLIETGNSSIGPCIHNRRSCRANIGSVCVPDGNHELLQIKEVSCKHSMLC